MKGRSVAIFAFLAALALCGWWLARMLVVTTDLAAFLPASSTPTQSLVVRELRDGVASRLVLVGLEGSDALAADSRALAAVLERDPRFGIVANGDPSRSSREQTLVQQWRYLLSPAIEPSRFTAEGLRNSLEEAVLLLASPLAPIVQKALPQDPTGELVRLASLFAGSGGAALRDGVWFAADGKRALLVVQTRAAGYDLDAQAEAADAIRQAFARVASPGTRILLSSPGLVAVESRRLIEHDARLASALTLAGVVLLLVATYRSAWPVALSALPALSGLAGGVVAVSAVFGPVHAITLGFGAMVIGEAIDYPTYLFANHAAGETLVETERRIGRTLTLAVATTACGALAMLLSGFRGLAQLGLLIIAGVIVAGTVTRYVLPALTPPRALAHKRARAPFDATRALAPLRKHAWVVGMAVLAAVIALLARRDTLWDDDLANLNPVLPGVKALDRELRQASGAPDLRYLIAVAGPNRESALAASERVAISLDRAIEQGVLASYDAAARYLPSVATQRRRLDALPDADSLRRNLRIALAGLPFRDDTFEPFLADVATSRDRGVLTRAHLDGSALALKVDLLLVEDGQRWWALLPLAGVTDPGALRKLADGADLLFLDFKRETDALVAGWRGQAIASSALGLALIVAIVYVGLRSVPATLRMLVPVLGAVVLTAGTLVALGQKLTVFHLVALLLVVGVGLNYALFFGRPHASAAERDLTLLSITVAALATLCASAALALTTTPVLRAIGMTTGLGALAAFVCAAAISRDN